MQAYTNFNLLLKGDAYEGLDYSITVDFFENCHNTVFIPSPQYLLSEIVFYRPRQVTKIPNTIHFLLKLPKYRPKNWQIPNIVISYAPHKVQWIKILERMKMKSVISYQWGPSIIRYRQIHNLTQRQSTNKQINQVRSHRMESGRCVLESLEYYAIYLNLWHIIPHIDSSIIRNFIITNSFKIYTSCLTPSHKKLCKFVENSNFVASSAHYSSSPSQKQ